MKIYLIMHSGKPQWYKLEAWSEIERIYENGVVVKAVKAFTKKKYAKEWIEKNECQHLQIRSVTVE